MQIGVVFDHYMEPIAIKFGTLIELSYVINCGTFGDDW